jgi:DNA repair protein RecO (recombination protein O)
MWQVRGASVGPADATEIRLGLTESEASLAIWPHAFDLEIVVTVGPQLHIELIARNPGDPIDPAARYEISGGRAARRLAASEVDKGMSVAGSTLLAMSARDFSDPTVAAESKALLRQVIRYHLDGKPLNTRRILQDLKKL